MKRNTKFIISLIFSTFIFQLAQAAPVFKGNERIKYNFNSQWLLYTGDIEHGESAGLDDSSWKQITLPRAFNEDEAFKLAIDEHSTGIVWYRKHFKLPESDNGKKIFLEFEGIRFGGEFYINGKSIGTHENGVMACGFDITEYVYFNGKENTIAVRIDNSWNYKEKSTGSGYQWNDKNFNANYGGIPKNVYLHVTNKLYQTLPLYSNLKTTGTYIYARKINISASTAQVFAESEIKNEYGIPKSFRYESVIEDMDGKIISTFSSSEIQLEAGETKTINIHHKVSGLNFWSWGYGYLYNIYTILYVDNKPVDVVKTRTGFRKTTFGNGMIRLNDRVIQIKGYAQRTSNEWPAVGMSVPPWLSDFSNRMIVEGNGNLVRWMHVTPWKQDVESCDRVGLIQAMPAGDAEKDIEGRRWEQRLELMRDAIIYNRNNPSILFYESGNKGISEEHMQQMKDIRDKYDPYGGRAIGSREMLDSKIAEYGGEMLYINKSAGIPMWATEYCRDEALRKYWDEHSFPFHKDGDGFTSYKSTVTNKIEKKTDASAYNRNQDSFAVELVKRWYDYFRVRPGTGKRISSGGAKIIFSDSNTHFRGVENYRRSGVTDAMRIPKDGFFAHQVMWDGWVDIENHHTYIIGHWNYQPATVKDIHVVSTGDEVELLVNGKSKGKIKGEYNFLFTFKGIQWEEGVLEAISYTDGKTVGRDIKKTAGKPASIKTKLMQAPDGFKADGADFVLVEVEVVDKDGNRCPLANNIITFDLSGPAEWRGGIAQGDDNYILSKKLPVECGINRVLIRSTTKSGDIKLTASAEGLQPSAVTFSSIPFEQTNGISAYISGDYQPTYLGKGKTPDTKSYTASRNQIDITGATTGSNQDKARFSFDDNEKSEWENDGNLNTAWITFELARKAVVSEIELKLQGWRSKSYPIEILIDDNEVYKGNTEKSLGYVPIRIKPTKGKFVTIRLIGQTSEKDAFGDIVEVTGKKLEPADPKNKKNKGSLRIVEADVYEAVK